MSIYYYECDNCGETFADVQDDVKFCECGKSWCCWECAEENGAECDDDGYIVSCGYCRKEKFTPDEVMRGLMDAFNLNDDDVLRIMKAR